VDPVPSRRKKQFVQLLAVTVPKIAKTTARTNKTQLVAFHSHRFPKLRLEDLQFHLQENAI